MGERERMTDKDSIVAFLEGLADDACIEHKPMIYSIINSVDYADKVSHLPNCNDCGKRKTCKHLPPLGEFVRINCFDWESVNK